MDYKTWKKQCNQILVANIGLDIDSLPDALWMDYYQDKMSPQQAIECAIEDAWYDEPFIRELFNDNFCRVV